MSSATTSPLTNRSTHTPVNEVEAAMTSHLFAISLSTLSAMELKHDTFSCVFLLPWMISLPTFNRRTPLLMLMFAVVSLSYLVPLASLLMAKLFTLADLRSTSSTTGRRTTRNPTLLDLGKPNLTSVTSAAIASNTTTTMRVTLTSSASDASPPAITLPFLHLLLHPHRMSFPVVPT